MVVHPTDREYKDIVRNKLLAKFPITTHDTTSKNYIFRPDLSGVRVKKVRNKPSSLDTE